MNWQATAKLEEFGIGGPDLWQEADITAAAHVERDELDRDGRTDYGRPHVTSIPVFVVDLHILSDDANRAYANRLAAMYEADKRFRDAVNTEIIAQAERDAESSQLELLLTREVAA